MSEDINFVKSVYFCGMETPPEEAVLKVKHSSVRIENPLLACIAVQSSLVSRGLLRQPEGNETFRQRNIMESLPERQLETRIYDRLCLKY